MTIPSTPLVDARLDACTVHDWKTSLPGPTIVDIARHLERANAVLVEALNRAAENMRIAAAFHVCSNCERGESLARAALEAGKVNV